MLSERSHLEKNKYCVIPSMNILAQAGLPRKVSSGSQGNDIEHDTYTVHIFFEVVEIIFKWAGEFSQQLRVLTEDLSLGPNPSVSS